MSIIEFDSFSFDTESFEASNDLAEPRFLNSTTYSGTFTISDGTVYKYQYDTDLFINKL